MFIIVIFDLKLEASETIKKTSTVKDKKFKDARICFLGVYIIFRHHGGWVFGKNVDE